MGQPNPARIRPTSARLLWLPLALALASATVLAGAVLADDDGGPAAKAAATTLALEEITIDTSQMVDEGNWDFDEFSATWDTPGFTGDYSWELPSSIPAGGAEGVVEVTSTDKSGGRYNGVITAAGDIIDGGPARAEALADKNGGQMTQSDDQEFVLLPGPCGSSCIVDVFVQDGPIVSFHYVAEECPEGRAPFAHASAINEVRVTKVEPGVAYHPAGADDDVWCNVEVDTVLKQGDEISCDPDGRVTLQFADNHEVVVKNTSQLKIASFFTEGGTVKTEILLKMGAVAARVHKSEATKSDFRIKSPTATTSRRGTTFGVFYDPGSKATLVSVTDGLAFVDPTKRGLENVTVRPGKEVEVTPKAVSDVAKIGKAGARGGATRLEAINKVLNVIAKNDDPGACGVTTPRKNAYSIGTAKKGWKLTVKLIGRPTNAGKSKWKVIRGKVRPANALARRVKKGCA